MSKRSSLRAFIAQVGHSELFQIILLLSLGIAIIFWQVLILNYVQVPADIPTYADPVLQEANPELAKPQNALLGDHIYQFYVWHTVAAESFQESGDLALWNPYILAGQPLLANAQPALFYPPNLLLLWFDVGLVASIRPMFNLLIAGIFTFLFSRALHTSKTGAMLSAIAFTFSGALIVGPGHAYANCLVWLPMILWSGEKMLEGSRSISWALILSIGVGLTILGGHPESSFHNLVIVAIYFVVRLIQLGKSREQKFKLLGLFLGSLALGVLLSAVQWLPFVSWWLNSANPSRSPAWNAESVFYSSEWLFNLPLLITLAFPDFFGNPVDGTYYWPFESFQNYLEQAMYFGLIPLTLAVGVIFTPRRRNHAAIGILAVLAIVLLAVALRLPVFETVNHLPFFDRVNNQRLKWYFSFLGAILAGLGLDRFFANIRDDRKANHTIYYPLAAVYLTSLFVILGVVIGKYVLTPLLEIRADSLTYHLLFNIFAIGRLRTTTSILVLVIGLGSMVYVVRARRQSVASKLPTLYVALTFIELVLFAYGYNTMVAKEQIFPEVKLTETLEKDPDVFRILSMPPTFWPNYGAVYGLYHVGGYDLPVNRQYADIYRSQGGRGYRQIWSPDWPLVDWMNIKYVISPHEYNLDKLELVYEDGYRVYRNKDVLPRAYMVYHAQVINNDEKMLAKLTSGEMDFRHSVLLTDELPKDQLAVINNPSNKTSEEPGAVEIVNFSTDDVVMEVATQKPGLLVMSDVYAPGWKALLDGKPVPLLRANYSFRAVFVPAGTHSVSFLYQPQDFQIGAALSGIALFILVTGLLQAWLASRKHLSRSLT